MHIDGAVRVALLPRVWSTRRDRKSALTLRQRKSGKFYECGEDAVGLFCQFWANPAVWHSGLQSLRCPHGRATPGIRRGRLNNFNHGIHLNTRNEEACVLCLELWLDGRQKEWSEDGKEEMRCS